MSDPTPTAADLAERLRHLALTLHSGEVGGAGRAAALEHLEAAIDLLAGGEPRLRWYEVDAADAAATRSRNRELSTYTGKLNVLAPPMTVHAGELADGRAALIGRVALDRLREGPPRAVHGGVVAGLFDELLGAGQRLAGGGPGVTGRLTVRYRRPTPIGEDLEFRVWVHDNRTRRVVLRGDCRVAGSDPDRSHLTAEAEAVFLRIDFAGMEAQMRDRDEGQPSAPAPNLGTGP